MVEGRPDSLIAQSEDAVALVNIDGGPAISWCSILINVNWLLLCRHNANLIFKHSNLLDIKHVCTESKCKAVNVEIIIHCERNN